MCESKSEYYHTCNFDCCVESEELLKVMYTVRVYNICLWNRAISGDLDLSDLHVIRLL